MKTLLKYTCPYIREAFSTSGMLALMGLLARVSTDMNSKSTPLDEALATTWSHTGVWTLICMYAVMSLEVRLPVEALGTYC